MNEPPAKLEYGTAPPQRWPRIVARLCVVGAVILFLFLVALIMLPEFGREREPAKRVRCSANMRQIWQAAQLYASSHHGRYPPDLPTLFVDQDLTPAVFNCPSSNDQPAVGPTTQAVAADLSKPGHASYIYVGKGLTDQTATADVVVLYEPLTNHAKSGMNVLFGDGHVDWYTATQAQPILRQVAAGTWPVRDPPAIQPASKP